MVKPSVGSGPMGDRTIQIYKPGTPGQFILKHVYALLPALNLGSGLPHRHERDQRGHVTLVGGPRQQMQKQALHGT